MDGKQELQKGFVAPVVYVESSAGGWLVRSFFGGFLHESSTNNNTLGVRLEPTFRPSSSSAVLAVFALLISAFVLPIPTRMASQRVPQECGLAREFELLFPRKWFGGKV